MRLGQIRLAEAHPSIVRQLRRNRSQQARLPPSPADAPPAPRIQSRSAAQAYRQSTGRPRSGAAQGCRTDAPHAIAVHHRDPHLRHHLREARIERLQHPGLALPHLSPPAGVSAMPLSSIKPRTHRARAIPNQHRSMVNVAAVARLYRNACQGSADPPPPAPDAPRRSPSPSARAQAPRSPNDPTAEEDAHRSRTSSTARSQITSSAVVQRLIRLRCGTTAPQSASRPHAHTAPHADAATCPKSRGYGDFNDRPGRGAFLSRRWGHGPSRVCSETTHASRSGSIAGFVTCANLWRKYAYTGRGALARNARGVSSPIDHTASLPSAAIGCRIIFTSSRVYPKPRCRAANCCRIRARRGHRRKRHVRRSRHLAHLLVEQRKQTPHPRRTCSSKDRPRSSGPGPKTPAVRDALRIEIDQTSLRAGNHKSVHRHRDTGMASAHSGREPRRQDCHRENAIAAGPSHGSAQSVL